MAPYNGEPDWAQPGAATGGAPAVSAEPVNTGEGNKAVTKDRSKTWHRLISFVIIGLCAAMCALGVFVIMKNRTLQNFADWFIASYMILFSVLLFFYEATWWCTIGSVNKMIRKNFGFMYNVKGKALYMIFAACLCIGINSSLLGKMDWLRYLAGIGWFAMGVFLLVLSYTKPALFSNYYIPTRGLVEGNDADETV